MKEKEFIEAVIALYKQYGFSIGHEDSHGAFVIERFCEQNVTWLRDAIIDTGNDLPIGKKKEG